DYLDDPMLLFIPLRLMLGLVTGAVTALFASVVGVNGAHTVVGVFLAMAAFVLVCQLLLPLLLVGRDPEGWLEILLPGFTPVGRAMSPLTRRIARSITAARRPAATTVAAEDAAEEANEAAKAYIDSAAEEGLIAGEERRLLQSIVDFGDTLVREV